MTNLTILEPCLSGVTASGETTTGVWRDTKPLIGEAVSLGLDACWKVAEVIEFKAYNAEFPVYVAFVAKGDMVPAREQWISTISYEDHPNQGVTVAYSQTNQPIIQIGTVYRHLIPREKIAFLGYQSQAIAQWEMGEIQEFLPIQESPYRAVYLCQCSPKLVAA